MKIQHIPRPDMTLLFRNQLALMIDSFISNPDNEVNDERYDASLVAIRYLRTNEFNKKNKKEKRVIDTLIRTYVINVEETVLVYAGLN